MNTYEKQTDETKLLQGESIVLSTGWDKIEAPTTPPNPESVAVITIPNSSFEVVDLRGVQPTTTIAGKPVIEYNGVRFNKSERMPFAIIGTSPTGELTARGIWYGDETVIGRGDEKSAKRFGLGDPRISRRHFSAHIGEEGDLTITNHSANGTTVTRSSRFGEEDVAAKPTGLSSVEMSGAGLERFSSRVRILAEPLRTDSMGNEVIASGEDSADDFNYDDLFSLKKSDEELDRKTKEYIESMNRQRFDKRNGVSPEAITEASNNLARAVIVNPALKNILDTHLGSPNVMDNLRQNHVLRCAVIDFFLRKFDDVRVISSESLPERVRRDDPDNLKAPNSDGYPVDKLRSSEYVALLALSMIDGSFDTSRADSTPSHTNRDGTVGIGQHRTAARVLLGIQ